MVTLILALTFIAFYLLYGISKKMGLVDELGLTKWSAEHRKASKFASLALMLFSLGLSCHYWGLGSGTLTFFILLTTVASLTILLTPLRLLNHHFLGIVFLCSVLLETIFF